MIDRNSDGNSETAYFSVECKHRHQGGEGWWRSCHEQDARPSTGERDLNVPSTRTLQACSFWCHMPTSKRITRAQILHLLNRLAVLIAATWYVAILIDASARSFAVARGVTGPLTTFETHEGALIGNYVGNATVRESKLIQILGDSTAPREDSLYLESITTTSSTGCSTPKFNADIYHNTFLRNGFTSLVVGGAYNLTFLPDHELIMPVIDCTFPPVVDGDVTMARVFFLTRLKDNPEDVYVMTVSMAVVNYVATAAHQEGAALVATFTVINDIRVAKVTHHFAVALGYPYDPIPSFEIYECIGQTSDAQWLLQSIPRDPTQERVAVVRTAKRKGFYIASESQQSNVKNMYWTLDTDPTKVMSVWSWQGRAVLHDSWAWVHYIHIVFALRTLFDHLVLCLVMYRNLRRGKVWIGDAFASVSNTLVYRGILVLISWYFNEFWTLMELCVAGGFEMAGIQSLFYHPEIARADFITLYLCSVNILGYAMKQRIDPAFTILVFEIGFHHRVAITQLLPSGITTYVIDYSSKIHTLGIAQINSISTTISPLRLWTVRELPQTNWTYVVASTLAISVIVYMIAVGYVIVRKLHRRFHPEQLYSQRVATYQSTSDDSLEQKRTLTLFEIATGAELQNRFGVIADYENFVYFKGLKFASADGIYCNGFVIANGEFLIATEDILVIIIMKVLKTRLRNVYTYAVDGNKLKQTAQLVYPETITWADLLQPNVSILS